MTENSVQVINETDLPTENVLQALADQDPVYRSIANWYDQTQSRAQGVFQRDRYLQPKGLFDEIRIAQAAAEEDDTVSNAIETTEQLAIDQIEIICEDPDEEDVWRQILEDIKIRSRFREIWREVFISSNSYVAWYKGRKDYRVGGKSESGTKRKKTFKNLIVPLGISVLDPLKIVPYGNFLFEQEKLAYIASNLEMRLFNDTQLNSSDLILNQLIDGPAEISLSERRSISNEIGHSTSLPLNTLFKLKEDQVFRITATRPAYQRFAPCRMKAIFELLDLKHQLREMDRAFLLGGTNFIVLIKKGTDKLPAKQAEVAQLAAAWQASPRIPVMVTDHRVDVEIITPKLDKTLSPERYNALDQRITARLFQLFSAGNYSSGTANDDSIKLIRVVAQAMEARRDSIKDVIQRKIIDPIFEANPSLTSEPKLEFSPRQIALAFDPNIAVFYQDLRDRGDASRETLLGLVGLSEEDEARRRRKEQEKYDAYFTPTTVPFSGQTLDGQSGNNPSDTNNPQGDGTSNNTKGPGRRGGGATGGGGANRNSGTSGPPRGPATSRLREQLAAEQATEKIFSSAPVFAGSDEESEEMQSLAAKIQDREWQLHEAQIEIERLQEQLQQYLNPEE